MTQVSRRTVTGMAAAGLSLPLLSACGGEESTPKVEESAGSVPTINCPCHQSKFSAVDGSVVSGPATAPLGAADVVIDGDNIAVDGTVLATTADIPSGGGTVFSDAKIVVTQPEAGEFKAFSAVCTHQGCTVNEVTP